MKIIEFYGSIEGKKKVISLLKTFFSETNYEIPVWLNQLENISTFTESFNIRCIVDEDNDLIDYCIFDPYQKYFNGYVDYNGWSHWENQAYDYLPENQQKEIDNLLENIL